MMKLEAVGYARVSTQRQADLGVSLDDQRARIAGWCVANGRELVKVYSDEGFSGSRSDNRPALGKCLKDAKQRKCPVVVFSLSRLSRSTKDTLFIVEDLQKAGADLASISEALDTSSSSGKMVMRIIAVLAEFARETISENTQSALAHLRSQNKRISRYAPYGFNLSPNQKDLIPNAEEQREIKEMARLRKNGMTLEMIAASLNLREVPGKRGGKWRAEQVRRLLDRAGLTCGAGEVK